MGPFKNHTRPPLGPGPGRAVSPFNPALECHPDFGKKSPLRANDVMPVFTIDKGLNEYHPGPPVAYPAGNFTLATTYPAQYHRQQTHHQSPAGFISRDMATMHFGGEGQGAGPAAAFARAQQIDPDAIPPPPPPPSVSPRMRPCLYARTPRGTKRCNQIA